MAQSTENTPGTSLQQFLTRGRFRLLSKHKFPDCASINIELRHLLNPGRSLHHPAKEISTNL